MLFRSRLGLFTNLDATVILFILLKIPQSLLSCDNNSLLLFYSIFGKYMIDFIKSLVIFKTPIMQGNYVAGAENSVPQPREV